MFSKALYRQSWKANWIQWLAITLVSSFILIIIMFMSGGDGIGSITSSFRETFVKDQLESEYNNTSLSYYSISEENLIFFDAAFIGKYLEQIKDNKFEAPTEEYVTNAYLYALSSYETKVSETILNLYPAIQTDQLEYIELMGAAMFSINPNGMFDHIFLSDDEVYTETSYVILSLINSIDQNIITTIWMEDKIELEYYSFVYSNERELYRKDRSRNTASIFISYNLNTEEGLNKILETLEEVGINKEIYDTFDFDYKGLRTTTNNAIITYQARLDYELSLIHPDDYESEEQYQTAVTEVKTNIRDDITKTLITRLPESLASSMSEMQDYDVYKMTVGNMYFKLVGLLISVVFVIIIGINLIVGQVDSGSMVYILSTGTKRNTVTFTQMMFFISSTVFLYLTTTIISLVVYYISPPLLTPVNAGSLILFNVGSFLVTMTLGSIVYLSSCIFNRSKHAIALGGGFSVLTLVFTILGMFASDSTPQMMRMDALNPFNNVSLVTLFDIDSIVSGTYSYIWKFAILITITIISFILGIKTFNKKDLPL